jgi:nucleoid-associated protein YgaU
VIDEPTELSDGGPSACPFVAFEDDRDHRSSKADHRHRCFAAPEPEPRAFPHQETYCLTAGFAGCPIFLDWARQEAAAVKVPVAPARRPGLQDEVAAAVAADEPLAPAFLAARSSTPPAAEALPRRTDAAATLWSYDSEGKRSKASAAPVPPSSLGAPAVAMARRGPSHPGWENPPRLESFPRLRSREEHRANQPLLIAAICLAILMAALWLFPIVMSVKGPTAVVVNSGTLPVPTGVVASPSPSAGAGGATFYQYTIQSGDQMWAIAVTYHVTLANLQAANPQVKDPAKIQAGQVLNIPPIGWKPAASPSQ